MPDHTFALLIFNRNQTEEVIRNAECLEEQVDEIIIIDSSFSEAWNKLRDSLQLPKAKLYHVFSLGYVEPLRMYALSKIHSDFTLYLDADESLSNDLRKNLRSFTACDGYEILRRDPSGMGTYQLRLYKTRAVTYHGLLHEQPHVEGTTCRLDRSFYISHSQYDFHNLEKYMEIEAYERPFPYRYMFRRFRKTAIRVIPKAGLPKRVFGKFFISLLLLGLALKYDDARDAQVLSSWHQYLESSYNSFAQMSIKDQLDKVEIYNDIERNNGVIKYLGLDNPQYVEKLSLAISEKDNGLEIFKDLLNFRFIHGMPMRPDDVRLSEYENDTEWS